MLMRARHIVAETMVNVVGEAGAGVWSRLNIRPRQTGESPWIITPHATAVNTAWHRRGSAAFRHFESMIAHPVRGHLWDTRLAKLHENRARVLMAAARTPSHSDVLEEAVRAWERLEWCVAKSCGRDRAMDRKRYARRLAAGQR